MTERIKALLRSSRDGTPFLKWKNTSGEIIPAYACVKLDAYDEALDFYNAVKPDGEGSLHFVNGPVPVAVNAYSGSQLWDQSLIGKTISMTFGEIVGPTAGSWEMTTGGSGWVVFSTPADGIAALLKEGGGGGGDNSIWGIIEEVVCDAYDPVTGMYVWASVLEFSGGCDNPIPGQITDEYDPHFGMIKVFQKCDIFTAYYTSSQLKPTGEPGKLIEAGWYYPREGYCEPKWLVRQVCGEPRCR